MNQEIETKFDIPPTIPDNIIISGLEECATRCGFHVGTWEIVTREFQYYDTPELHFYTRGETVRRVSGFDLTTAKARFRYDYKTGSLEDRYEQELLSDEELSLSDIAQKLSLPEQYRNISISASAPTTHTRAKITRNETVIKTTIDYFDVRKGTAFKELELELGQGNKEYLQNLSQMVIDGLYLQRIHKQKYSRVIELL